MRWYCAAIFGILTWAGAFSARSATVELEDGRRIEGRVIVRNNIATVKSTDSSGRIRLYQFPVSQVIRVQGDAQNPNVVRRKTALRAGDSRRSEPLQVLEKGMEVKRLAGRRSWVKVEAWNEEIVGFVLELDLGSEAEFTPAERREAREQLGLMEIPPAPRATESTQPADRIDPDPGAESADLLQEASEEIPLSDSDFNRE